jgi:hypothetical protein
MNEIKTLTIGVAINYFYSLFILFLLLNRINKLENEVFGE